MEFCLRLDDVLQLSNNCKRYLDATKLSIVVKVNSHANLLH